MFAFATGAENCLRLVKKLFPNGKKVYLIQGFENWVMSEDELYKTYQEGFTNIVVSSWLEKIVNNYSKNRAVLIKNPIDLNVYFPNTPIEKKKDAFYRGAISF